MRQSHTGSGGPADQSRLESPAETNSVCTELTVSWYSSRFTRILGIPLQQWRRLAVWLRWQEEEEEEWLWP